MGKTGQPSIYGKLRAATSMALEVKLSCQEAMEARSAFEMVERLKLTLAEKKNRLQEIRDEYDNVSDDSQLDFDEELEVLTEEISTLEGVLHG
jgi:hypothetical protein